MATGWLVVMTVDVAGRFVGDAHFTLELLSLAIAGAAAVLGMYHAIVLHFA